MRVSRRCEYALRALCEMAERGEERPLRIEDIARRQKIPRNFLANLLVVLKRGGFVRSKKGPEGGYQLARPAQKIAVGEIVRFVDGPIAPIHCLLGAGAEQCDLAGDCAYFPLWGRVQAAVAEILDGTTVSDVIEEQRVGSRSAKPVMFHI